MSGNVNAANSTREGAQISGTPEPKTATAASTPAPRGAACAQRPAQPVSAARPPVEASSEGRPEAPWPGGYRSGGYMMRSGMVGGFMLGSGN